MRRLLLILSLVIVPTFSALAEVSVIVNPANSNSLDKGQLKRIWLGKMKSYPDGGSVMILDQANGAATRDEFLSKVIGKSGSQYKAYWSKLLFTGKGKPPKELSSDADIIAEISKSPGAIGYINSSAVTGDVKVIATF